MVISVYVADDCPQLWLLYPGGALGRYRSSDRDAHDSENLCVCVDGLDLFSGYEKGKQPYGHEGKREKGRI